MPNLIAVSPTLARCCRDTESNIEPHGSSAKQLHEVLVTGAAYVPKTIRNGLCIRFGTL